MATGSFANPAQAALALRRALARDPGNATFRLGLMELYRVQGRAEQARALGEESLREGPPSEDLHQLMRLVYAELGAEEPLLALLHGRAGEGPETLEAAAHAAAKDQWDTALSLFKRGLERCPEDWEAWLMMCNVLMHAHRLDEALERASWLLDQGVQGEVRARLGFLKGVALMLQGRFKEGLPWLEVRFAMAEGPHLEALPVNPWEGGDLAGKTLVIQTEQGFGDAFMLARYVAVLAGLGAKVLLQPQVRTQGVLATCEGLAGLAEGDLVLPGEVLHAPIMSLPRLCGTRLDSIPNRVPYLHVPALVPNRDAIDACLAQAEQPRRIGLVWAGNPRHVRDHERSMPPEVLELLAPVPGVTWVDLQVEPGPRPQLPMLDLARHLGDFSDTAYALSLLDGLISVDSSPVHLAGALGRPAWLALTWLPDWRWLLERRDSPWYPTLELWRQPSPGNWTEVVLAMRARLLDGGW